MGSGTECIEPLYTSYGFIASNRFFSLMGFHDVALQQFHTRRSHPETAVKLPEDFVLRLPRPELRVLR